MNQTRSREIYFFFLCHNLSKKGKTEFKTPVVPFGGDSMYSNIENLNRYKEELENIIRNCQLPTNNLLTTNQTPPKDLVEWRILNENEEVDNLYVATKTLFINDNLMVLKGVDGSLEKWEVKKVYPVDKKDIKINELEEKIKELEMRLNEPTEPTSSAGERNKSVSNADVNAESKSKASPKYLPKQTDATAS